MRIPALVLLFENRPGVHDETELGPLLGFQVLADVVAHPVRQRADLYLRIDRDPSGENGSRIRGLGLLGKTWSRESESKRGENEAHDGGWVSEKRAASVQVHVVYALALMPGAAT